MWIHNEQHCFQHLGLLKTFVFINNLQVWSSMKNEIYLTGSKEWVKCHKYWFWVAKLKKHDETISFTLLKSKRIVYIFTSTCLIVKVAVLTTAWQISCVEKSKLNSEDVTYFPSRAPGWLALICPTSAFLGLCFNYLHVCFAENYFFSMAQKFCDLHIWFA